MRVKFSLAFSQGTVHYLLKKLFSIKVRNISVNSKTIAGNSKLRVNILFLGNETKLHSHYEENTKGTRQFLEISHFTIVPILLANVF